MNLSKKTLCYADPSDLPKEEQSEVSLNALHNLTRGILKLVLTHKSHFSQSLTTFLIFGRNVHAYFPMSETYKPYT